MRWVVHYSFVEGPEDLLLTCFCEGQLRIVTDGSHHPEWNLATAALCAVAQDDTCLTTVLQTPGRDDDLQSHIAELSGHFAAVKILEQLKRFTLVFLLRILLSIATQMNTLAQMIHVV